MRQYEFPPRGLFNELSKKVKEEGPLVGYLFDTGLAKTYSTEITRILMAPPQDTIATPDPEKSPPYYQRGSYPAWFLLKSIEEIHFTNMQFIYDSFPTRPELQGTLGQLVGHQIKSLEQLRQMDVTLWVVQT